MANSLTLLIETLVSSGVTPSNCTLVPKNKLKHSYKHATHVVYVKPAIVYYIKLCFPDDVTLYKLGYTSTSLRTRIKFMELPKGTKVTTLQTCKLSSSKKAFYAEQLLHQHFAPYRYYGQSRLASGNTELYSTPLF